MKTKPENRPYVEAVTAALKTYEEATDGLTTDGQPTLIDSGRVQMLLASIRHWCDAHDVAYAEADKAAHNVYTGERVAGAA